MAWVKMVEGGEGWIVQGRVGCGKEMLERIVAVGGHRLIVRYAIDDRMRPLAKWGKKWK
jgi:hypothetical protein